MKGKDFVITDDFFEQVIDNLPSSFYFTELSQEIVNNTPLTSKLASFLKRKIDSKEIGVTINVIDDWGEVVESYKKIEDLPTHYRPKGFFQRKTTVKSRNVQILYSKKNS